MGLIAGLGTWLGALLVVTCGRLAPTYPAAGLLRCYDGCSGYDLLRLHCVWLQRIAEVGAARESSDGILDLGLNILAPSLYKGSNYLKMGYLIAAGIALHDLPEGFAIAAGFAATEGLGPLLALAIGLHNIPEGMATAAPLRYGGMNNRRILALNAAISLVTPLGTCAGLVLVETSPTFIGTLLAFAAGAMSYIILGELAPASRRNHKILAYAGMLAGFGLIALLNFNA